MGNRKMGKSHFEVDKWAPAYAFETQHPVGNLKKELG